MGVRDPDARRRMRTNTNIQRASRAEGEDMSEINHRLPDARARSALDMSTDPDSADAGVVCGEPLTGVLVARLSGELDLSTVGPVRTVLVDALARAKPYRLIVDLSEVTLMSSRGIALLLRLHRYARTKGFHLVLSGCSHRRAHLPLQATGALPLFDTRLDILHAMAGLQQPDEQDTRTHPGTDSTWR